MRNRPLLVQLFENTAWPYISSVMEKYPSTKPDFARRLGEANERRYKRLQQKRESLMDRDLNDTDGSENDAGDAIPFFAYRIVFEDVGPIAIGLSRRVVANINTLLEAVDHFCQITRIYGVRTRV